MNFFPIGDDCDPVQSAIYMCDQHVSNQQRETAQMLSTVVHLAWPEQAAKLKIYKPTHANHPCTKWLQQGFGNMAWGFNHAFALWEEHYHRMGTRHASFDVSLRAYQFILEKREAFGATLVAPSPSPMPKVLNDDFRGLVDTTDMSVLDAYRAYYRYKHDLWLNDRRAMRWTNREKPSWLT